MIAKDRLFVDLRNEWAVQSLVVFSFMLQVFLLMFAWIRRYNVSTMPRLFLWLAYQLADSTAVFTLGHLSISSKLPDHQLVAFWAPFLLVHLGGQDTITAYSFEDNRLWLRHLQTLVVQVLGVSYVLYKYMPTSEKLVMEAALLIFVVGVLKYGERIWTLRSASFDSIWSSLDKLDAGVRQSESDRHHLSQLLKICFSLELDAETILMGAHSLLNVCKGLFIGVHSGRREYVREVMRRFYNHHCLDKLMEMELSLMYDILYTKAAVIHTWCGCCIRIISVVATVAALLLFQLSIKHHEHNKKDVVITYVLLVGAVLLEIISLVRAVMSTWTRAFLYDRGWYWLHGEILCLRRLVGAASHRRWSGSVGQYNLLWSCARDKGEPTVIKAANSLGLHQFADYWWSTLRHSKSAELSDSTKELVLGKILEMGKGGEEIGSLPGLLTLKGFLLGELVGWSTKDIGFEDSIMAWHIASEICLSPGLGDANLRKAISVLSNYMMFLLVLRPYMLPGPVRRSRYDQVRDDLYRLMQKAKAESSDQERLDWALCTGLHAQINSVSEPAHYDTGVRLAHALYQYRPNSLNVIFGVWVEMLCYVANHCSRESHARQLSSGGELLTIVWLMARHANLSYIG